MDRRFLTVLGVSLVFALVVSSVFYQMTSRGETHKAPVTATRDIVVSARPLGVGVLVKPADVKIVKIPAEAFPKGAYSKVEEVLDRGVISNILLEEPIMDGRLAAKGSGLGLATTIPVGMRAVTVRVNDVAAVAGFVLPGMHVDVLVTGHPPTSDGSDITTTCLQNILVLSSGQTLQPDARGQAINAPTVTLLGTPEQAEMLALANVDTRIQLVLRNSSDDSMEKTPGRNIEELYGVQRRPVPVAAPAAAPKPKPKIEAVQTPPPPPPAAAAPPAPPPPDQVVMIRGTQRTVEILPSRNN
jgi:pilus assembly protein CpaB